MTRLEALIALKEAVEAGEWPGPDMHDRLGSDRRGDLAYDAFHGSLDAAQALHEEVLPGWRWAVAEGATNCRAAVQKSYGSPEDQGIATCPARAWLLAILSALIAKEQKT